MQNRLYTQSHDRKSMTRIVLAFVAILLCLVSLSSSTYALYGTNVTTTNAANTKNYALTVTFGESSQTALMTAPVTLDLEAGSASVTIVPVGGSGNAANGFALLTFSYTDSGNTVSTTCRTGPLTGSETLVFNVGSGADAKLTVAPHWGAPTDYPALSSLPLFANNLNVCP